MTSSDDLLDLARAQLPQLVGHVEALVEVESPSSDPAAVGRCGEVLDGVVQAVLGPPAERLERGGTPHLRWSFGQPRVLLVGHLDTVWPHGTLAERPFRHDGDRLLGPGVFDMKAGLIQAVAALSLLPDPDGVALLVTSDEEIGSPTSRDLVLEASAAAEAVLVFEGAAGHDLKTVRKGLSRYELHSVGRAAHAGLEPQRGANALIEAAHQVLATEDLAASELGTTVTPTMAAAGTASNVVAAEASVAVDVRAEQVEEQRRVHRALTGWSPRVPGVEVRVDGEINREPMPAQSTRALFHRAARAAEVVGLPAPGAASVGGVSDANLAAQAGAPVLDGLGAVGGGAHAVDEHVVVDTIPERVALAAALIGDLLTTPVRRDEC